MKIVDKILKMIEARKAKRLQKALIKTDDDKEVVEALASDEDNSNIDIYKVVNSMEDVENKVEVLDHNVGAMIAQDIVMDTLSSIGDDEIVKKFVKEHKRDLAKKGKLKNAIKAIEDNKIKLGVTEQSCSSLEDLEIVEIFDSLTQEEEEEKRKAIEQSKIRVVHGKIMNNIRKIGMSFHIRELTDGLSDRAKISILTKCLRDSNGEVGKIKLIMDLLRVMNVEETKKKDVLQKYQEKEMLTEDEVKMIEQKWEEERLRKEGKGGRE